MASNQSKREQVEKQAHALLGKLLRKKRNDADRKAVEDILKLDLPVIEKINRIQQLDEAVRSIADENAAELASGRIRPLRIPYVAFRELMRIPLRSPPFFTYLFNEYGLIRAFAARTHALSCSLVPPRGSISPQARSLVNDVLIPTATEQLPLCATLLDQAWLYLDRYQYNLIVVFHRLLDKIQAVNLSGIDNSDRNAADRLQSVETLFLFFHSRPEYVETILYSLDVAAKKDPSMADELMRLSQAVRMILYGEGVSPSLADVVVGLTMCKHRRHLTLEQMVPHGLGNLVNRASYACNEKVQEKINAAIEEGRARLAVLYEEQGRINEKRQFVPFAGSSISFDILQQFYEQATGRKLDPNANLLVALPDLISAFDDNFYTFFSDRLLLSNGNAMRLPVDETLPATLAKLRSIAERAFDRNKAGGGFARQRYFDLTRTEESAKPEELDLVSGVRDIGQMLVQAGRLIESLFSSMRFQTQLEDMGAEKAQILSKTATKGMVVQDAVRLTICVAYQMAAYCYHPELYDLPPRDAAIKKEMQQQLNALGRLAGPTALKSMRASAMNDATAAASGGGGEQDAPAPHNAQRLGAPATSS